MLKGLNRIWLRAVKRIEKAQRVTNNKLIKSILKVQKSAAKPSAKRVVPRLPKAAKVVAKKRPVPLTQTPGQWLASYYTTSTVPARRMQYCLYWPDNVRSELLPLVVMLHGCQQNATDFAQGCGMNLIAEKNGFAVLYLQQSLRAHRQRCWNWYELAADDGEGEAGMIASAIESVRSKYQVDSSRIYIAGMSAGAAMANIVGVNYPTMFAAIGLHSAPVCGVAHGSIEAFSVMQRGSLKYESAIQKMKKKISPFPVMPAILLHGSDDNVVRPINLGQLKLQFMALNELTMTNAQAPILKPANRGGKAHTLENFYVGKKLLLKVCTIAGLGHAWSGGDCALAYNACGGPDASKMMWAFFSKHRRISA